MTNLCQFVESELNFACSMRILLHVIDMFSKVTLSSSIAVIRDQDEKWRHLQTCVSEMIRGEFSYCIQP